MSLDKAGLRVLTRAECLHLLRTVNVGRVAGSHRALPMILPVHFRIADDDSITIETAHGTTLHCATDHAVVAFEAEGPAGSAEPSWSVIVHGVATHPGRADRFVVGGRVGIAISVDEVSGREVLDTTDPMAPAVTAAIARW
jgi:uncharacterized protein